MNKHDKPPHVIIERVCKYYGVTPKEFKNNIICKHACIYLLNKESHLTPVRIAELFEMSTGGIQHAISNKRIIYL